MVPAILPTCHTLQRPSTRSACDRLPAGAAPLHELRALLLAVIVMRVGRHNLDEILLPYRARPRVVRLRDHLVQLAVFYGLANLPRNPLEIVKIDLSLAPLVERGGGGRRASARHLVKQSEGLEQVVVRGTLGHLVEDDVEVAVKVQLPRVVLVDLRDLLLEVGLRRLMAERAHDDEKLLGVDRPGAVLLVLVEELEGILDLVQLVIGQLLLSPSLACAACTSCGTGRDGACGQEARSSENEAQAPGGGAPPSSPCDPRGTFRLCVRLAAPAPARSALLVRQPTQS
eukprot:1892487-Prymnesium_polylepis.2